MTEQEIRRAIEQEHRNGNDLRVRNGEFWFNAADHLIEVIDEMRASGQHDKEGNYILKSSKRNERR